MSEQQAKKRGFAAISPERLKQIASAGGVARKKAFDLANASRAKTNGQPQDGTAQEIR